MKEADELKVASRALSNKISQLINEFITEHGKCEVKISTSAVFYAVENGEDAYAKHDIEVTIKI